MKTIAFVSTNETAPWGGSEELWFQTALRMAREGFSIKASVMHWASREHPSIRQLEASGCQVQRREQRRSIVERAINKLTKNKLPYSWLAKPHPDLALISLGSSGEGVHWMEACANRSIPFVVIVHSASDLFWPRDEYLDRMAAAYSSARSCFFVSRRIIETVETQMAVKLENSRIVRNPYKVSLDFSSPMPPLDAIKMACVGSLEPISKGQDILFKVLSRNKWRERPVAVSIFGAGHNANSLRRLKTLLKLDNVQFCGYTDDIESVWESHHALVQPSRFEGMPITIVEAMLCGRVCIATDVGGNTELVSDNVNGFVAKAALPDFLDEALERAWQRRESWKDIGKLAANDIRRIVPRDPVGEFIKALTPIIGI